MTYHSMTQLEAEFQLHYELCPYCDKAHKRLCAIGYCKLRSAVQRLLARTTTEDNKDAEQKPKRQYRRHKIPGRHNEVLY